MAISGSYYLPLFVTTRREENPPKIQGPESSEGSLLDKINLENSWYQLKKSNSFHSYTAFSSIASFSSLPSDTSHLGPAFRTSSQATLLSLTQSDWPPSRRDSQLELPNSETILRELEKDPSIGSVFLLTQVNPYSEAKYPFDSLCCKPDQAKIFNDKIIKSITSARKENKNIGVSAIYSQKEGRIKNIIQFLSERVPTSEKIDFSSILFCEKITTV